MSTRPEDLKEAKDFEEELLKIQLAVQSKLREDYRDYTWVVLLGMCGAGKTTLLHILAGKRLVVKFNEGSYTTYYDAEEVLRDGDQEFIIGHEAHGETFVANIFVDKANKIVYVDCPGLLDTDQRRRVINAFTIDYVLDQASNVKILLVLSGTDVGFRALDGQRCMQQLSRMIPDRRQLLQSAGVVLTRIHPRANPAEMLEELKKGLNNEEVLEFIDLFLSNGRKQLFSFPQAPESGYTDSCFPDKEKIQEFVKGPSVGKIEHAVVLDDEADKIVLDIFLDYNDEKVKLIRHIVDELTATTDSVEGLDEIDKWLSYVSDMIRGVKISWNDFCKVLYDISKKTGMFEKEIECIALLAPIDKFISKLAISSESLRKRIEAQKQVISEMANEFENTFRLMKQRRKLIKHEIEREQYEKDKKMHEEELRHLREKLDQVMSSMDDTGKRRKQNIPGIIFRALADMTDVLFDPSNIPLILQTMPLFL